MNKSVTDYDMYLKGIKGELSLDVLEMINCALAPHGDYYDYENLRGVILKRLGGEIDDEYFREWLFLVIHALDEDKFSPLTWYLDGLVSCFTDFERSTLLELLAVLKDFDYRLRNEDFIAQHAKDKMMVIYLRFEHCNWTEDSSVYKAYFVDYKSKSFDIRFVDDAFFEFSDEINYCFLHESDSDDAEEDEPSPRELPEEEELMSYFYDEGDRWIYKHGLNF